MAGQLEVVGDRPSGRRLFRVFHLVENARRLSSAHNDWTPKAL